MKLKSEGIKPARKRLELPLILGVCLALFLIALAVIYAMGIRLEKSDWLGMGIIFLVASCLMLGLLLIFHRAVFRSPMRVYYAVVALWVLIFAAGGVLVLGAVLPSETKPAGKLLCTINLKRLEVVIDYYKKNSGGVYPNPARWCDLLVQKFNVPPDFFICSSAAPARCHYAMNPNCKPDSPGDVVLLFETKGGWNQHGGPELMSFENHEDRVCNVLFNDGRVAFVRPGDINKLNWVTEVKEAAVELKVGDEAPGFSLFDQNGEMVNLSDFAGKKVLVYFYPKADTPGCTKQACSVRDFAEELKKAGVVPLGISPDEPNEQRQFDKEYSLGFRLLSDMDHKIAEKYGVWSEKEIGGRKVGMIIRSSFLIDEKGKLIGVWYNVRPEDTVPKAMEALK
jgi:peroxiredoxin Q/BCP